MYVFITYLTFILYYQDVIYYFIDVLFVFFLYDTDDTLQYKKTIYFYLQ
jgi:hypothetical protein